MSLLLWSVLSCVMFFSDALEYSNRWTVQIDGDNEEANRLARKHGFVNQGKVIDNYYSFEHQMVERISNIHAAHLHKGLKSEPNVKMVEQQELKSYNLLSSHSLVEFNANDPRWEKMWYIKRDDGRPTYNVIDVWERNITGAGVVIAVVDEGLDPEHPELKANYDAMASFDVVDNDTYPVPSNSSLSLSGHGEKCAGVIAAVLNNSNCGVGLAYKARLGGIRLFIRTLASDADEARALSYAPDHVDIYSNSWGPFDWGNSVVGPGHLTQLALQHGTEKGRRGRGSIYVFSSGNGGGFYDDSCAFSGYVNSIYTIAITGLRSDGSLPVFSEPCAGIMAVTYSRDTIGDSSKVITADTKKACTDSFGASSASAAMASGLIALMLSAKPNLSWRDVQHIIVRTARPGPVKGSNWNTNKAGLKVSDRVGFGLMDAKKMVDLAVNWTTVPPKVICTVPRYGVNSLIPSNEVLEETINLINWSDFCGSKINFLEHVEVAVNLNYTRRGDLVIKLISPQGTLSNLTHSRMVDSATGATDLNWVLMSLHYWGENAIGSWKLTLQNSELRNDNTGTLFNWTLILHGTTLNPLDYNPHISTTVSPQPTEKMQSTESSNIPIHGGYTQWSHRWSRCSASCGWGTRYRSRSCTNPPPANRGRDCSGLGPDKKDVRICYKRICPVHGGYSRWSDWSHCSQSCGPGKEYRYRSCTNPRPAYGGRFCSSFGPSRESRTCSIQRCPAVHGGYSQWSHWSQCSRSCDGGKQHRNRVCTNPPPANGGRDCSRLGRAKESQTCKTYRCPVDGGYSDWSSWSLCSATCDNGTQERDRSCSNPPPANGGKQCEGPTQETRICSYEMCPTPVVDGRFSDWSSWSQCSVTCGNGTQQRNRSCTNPPPTNNGTTCRGPEKEARTCTSKLCTTLVVITRICRNVATNDMCTDWKRKGHCKRVKYAQTLCAMTCGMCTQDIPIDDGYKQWSSWSWCSQPCGGGTQTRTRSCTRPPPTNGGKGCSGLGRAKESRICNKFSCSVCRNSLDDAYCSEWKKKWCINSKFRQYCKLTCDLCSVQPVLNSIQSPKN